MKTFVIAEAGANHNRNFNQALKLIDIAKESGASAVKFQTYDVNVAQSVAGVRSPSSVAVSYNDRTEPYSNDSKK